MPELIPTPCRSPGCPAITTSPYGYCLKHIHLSQRRPRRKRRQSSRPSAHARGYSRSWQKARRLFLRDNPLCVRCVERQLIVPATVVDHIQPHRGDMLLFWNRDNWQSLCKSCHDRKTAREDRLTQ